MSISKFPQPKILDRYIISEVLSFVALTASALTIMLIVRDLFYSMDLLINEKIAWQYVIKLLLYRLPAYLVLTFPMSLLASSELAIGRLSTNSEITAMRAGGISLRRIIIPFVAAALVISILSFLINDYIVPEAHSAYLNIRQENILKKGPSYIKRNVFFRDAENRYFYINRFNEENMTMQDIMIYELNREHFSRTITAKKGEWAAATWKLENVTMHNYDEEGNATHEMNFAVMDIIVKEDLQKFFINQRGPFEMNSKELEQQINILQQAGADTKTLEVMLHMKYSVPFSGLIFVLLGVPLGLQIKRGSTAIGIIISIILVFVYYVFVSAARSFGNVGVVDTALAAWLPNIIFAILGMILIFRAEKK